MYTAEELMQLPPGELDSLVERLVIGGRPETGTVNHIHESWLKYAKSEESLPVMVPYSRSHAGMCFITEMMKDKGFSIEVEPDNAMWFSKEGKEYPRSPWAGMLKSAAIAAVLAVRAA